MKPTGHNPSDIEAKDTEEKLAETSALEKEKAGLFSRVKNKISGQKPENANTLLQNSDLIDDLPDASILFAEPAGKESEEPTPLSTPVITDAMLAEAEGKDKLFNRLKSGLGKTGAGIRESVGSLLSKKEIDDALFEELETSLLMADVGVETTTAIIESLTNKVSRKQLTDAEALYQALQDEMQDILTPCQQPLRLNAPNKPFVMLMVGVNGAGKTTTIGKMAKQFQGQGKSVMLAAGDTFRAAAVEQLQVWGERNNVPVIAQHTGADSASVVFDALQSAKSKGIDILIADTAGRLQNSDNLMEELKKVIRVMKKIDPDAPHEVMLIVDAGTGQNALSQAKGFAEGVNVTGLTLTKLDGTAKGGIIFAIAQQTGLPIRFIGIGEKIDDLRPFSAGEFVRALFAKES